MDELKTSTMTQAPPRRGAAHSAASRIRRAAAGGKQSAALACRKDLAHRGGGLSPRS